MMRDLKADLLAALKADLNALFRPGFAADWEAKRVVHETALDVMEIENLVRVVEDYAARRAIAAEERVAELKSAIVRALDRLQDHDHEDVYGPYGYVATQCIVHDSELCDVVADLQAVLEKGEGHRGEEG